MERVGADDQDRLRAVDVRHGRRELGAPKRQRGLALEAVRRARESTWGEPSAWRAIRWSR